MTENQYALLAADTDRTQDYVFESSRLPEIRGASRMLDDLNAWTEQIVRAAEGDVFLAAGGMLLAKVPQEKAAELAQQIAERFPDASHTATTTVAWRPVTEKMLTHGYPTSKTPFGSLMSWTGTWLRREKDTRITLPWYETPPFAERCGSCQVRPAAVHSSFSDRPLCPVCAGKYRYEGLPDLHSPATQFGRDYWFAKFQEALETDAELYAQYYRSNEDPFPAIHPRRGNRWTPQDLSEIGQASRSRTGYIGYVYLDGDQMGRVFKKAVTAKQATALSATIYEVAQHTVMAALARYLQPAKVQPSETRQGTSAAIPDAELDGGRVRIHPFEIITIGGDDLTLIVPADIAVPLACEISQTFQEAMCRAAADNPLLKPFQKEAYTLSGGVVLADDHNPVRALRDLAKDLARTAKQARHRANAPEGYLDYVAMLGTDMPDRNLVQSRKLYPYKIEQKSRQYPRLSLLGRPYAVSNLAAVWQTLQALKTAGFANSQMSLLAQSLFKGVQESSLFYQYQRARDRSGAFKHLDQALRTLKRTEENPVELWKIADQKAQQEFAARTVLWDLAELYSFA